MKMLFKIIKYRFTASLRHPVIIICLSAAVICSALVGIYAQKEQDAGLKYPIAIVDEDGGEFADIFIKELSQNQLLDVKVMDRDKAQRQVASGKVDGAFVILKGFSGKIKVNDYTDIIEFMSPTVTSSAYPVSEIVSAEVIDMWLGRLVENKTYDLYEQVEGEAAVSYEEILNRIKTEYTTQDILTVELITSGGIDLKLNEKLPVDKTVGVYAAFVIFAIMLSGEWIFNLKRNALQNRFVSNNTSLTVVCLGSQAAAVLVSMLFFAPLAIFMYVYMKLEISAALYLLLGMLLFSVSVCLMAFAVSALAENLTQLVVLGTSISIINILLSSLAMPAPNWAVDSGIISKVLPGTYLAGCYDDLSKLLIMGFMALIWTAISYLSVIKIRKAAKT